MAAAACSSDAAVHQHNFLSTSSSMMAACSVSTTTTAMTAINGASGLAGPMMHSPCGGHSFGPFPNIMWNGLIMTPVGGMMIPQGRAVGPNGNVCQMMMPAVAYVPWLPPGKWDTVAQEINKIPKDTASKDKGAAAAWPFPTDEVVFIDGSGADDETEQRRAAATRSRRRRAEARQHRA